MVSAPGFSLKERKSQIQSICSLFVSLADVTFVTSVSADSTLDLAALMFFTPLYSSTNKHTARANHENFTTVCSLGQRSVCFVLGWKCAAPRTGFAKRDAKILHILSASPARTHTRLSVLVIRGFFVGRYSVGRFRRYTVKLDANLTQTFSACRRYRRVPSLRLRS